jgi:hypothetical protein
MRKQLKEKTLYFINEEWIHQTAIPCAVNGQRSLQ